MIVASHLESSNEVQFSQELTILGQDDRQWLEAYGADPTWVDDPELSKLLNYTIITGSLRLDEPVNQDRWQEVVSARRSFLEFIGLSAELIDSFQVEHPTIIPLDTFIGTQRVMHSWSLDAAKLVNANPTAIGFAPESVREKMANFTALGIDAAKLVNANPSAIGLAPESVREKMANFTALGIDAAKLVNANPAAIGFAPESVREKMANFTALGIDAAKLVNANPSAINFAPESVREKMSNFTALGIDAPKLVNAMPSAIGFAPESVREKMANFTALGIDAPKLVNAMPSAIGFAPESVREKMSNFTALGIDAAKLVNAMPSAIGLAPESVREKMANFTALGIDAPKLVNAMPSAINFAPESVREKMANFAALDIDAAKLVNAMPSTINFAPESVRTKMLFLRRSIKLLKWEHSTEELVNTYPALIGFNTKKLAVLRRIAATHLDLDARATNPNTIRSSLMTPLEQYIIAVSRLENGQTLSLSELRLKARAIKLDSSERKELAAKIAPSLGRIGTMHETYRDKK